MTEIAEGIRNQLGVNERALPAVDPDMIQYVSRSLLASALKLMHLSHLTNHATHFFPPSVAVLGGLLAQDVLRALSKKDKPIVNLLVVDSIGGSGTVGRWAMAETVDA